MNPSRQVGRGALLGACLLLLAALVFRNMDLLADSFWYVATGRYVLEGGRFPAFDPFSFAAVRTPWIVHMPASVVLFASLDRLFGLSAILYFCAVVEAAALGALWLLSARTTPARLLAFPLIAFAVFLQREELCARGQVFGDLLFVALLAIGARLRQGLPVRWWIAPLLGTAWVNLHSSFPLGVLLPMVVAAGLLFDQPTDRPPLLPIVVFAGTFALGTLLNPYGPALIRDVLTLASHPTTVGQKLFLPPEFGRADTIGAFVLASGALAASASPKDGRGIASRIMVLVMLLMAAAAGLRYLSLLTYASIAAIGPALDTAAPRMVQGLRAYLEKAFPILARLVLASPLVTSAILLLIAIHASRQPKDLYAHVPIEAARYLKAHAHENVLNDYHWGGFLLYVWQGKPKVFIDGRSYLYYNGVFEDAFSLSSVAPGYAELLDVYEARSALLERNSALAVALEKRHGWTRAYQDRLAVVLERPETGKTKVGANSPK